MMGRSNTTAAVRAVWMALVALAVAVLAPAAATAQYREFDPVNLKLPKCQAAGLNQRLNLTATDRKTGRTLSNKELVTDQVSVEVVVGKTVTPAPLSGDSFACQLSLPAEPGEHQLMVRIKTPNKSVDGVWNTVITRPNTQLKAASLDLGQVQGGCTHSDTCNLDKNCKPLDLHKDSQGLYKGLALKVVRQAGSWPEAHMVLRGAGDDRVLVGDKPIELALQADEGCRGEFVGDSARVTQVILNLVSNAVKFTQSGRVTLRLECAPGDNGATKITATVADTGTGIEPELLEKIFTPFDQGNLRGEARRAGTGLGLSISRRLVHLMGGDLVVRSVVGAGSEFRFTVQLQPVAQAKAEAPDSSTSAATGPLDVLIADDSPASLLLMKILLQKRGHKVTAVTDGAQALEAATAARFDLAVLDLQMPNMGGIEATRRIRRLPPGQGCRFVVALTAEAFAEERRAALEAGMDEVMTKPFEDTEFDEMLKRLLANPDSNPAANPHSLKSPKAA